MVVETLEQEPRARRLTRVFKALGDETRMAIFQLLRECCRKECAVSEAGAERTVSEIAQEFGLALSTVSHHLKELRHAGLVLCSKQGKKVHCRINTALLRELEEFMR
jgi:ArsR family transcriptional regulator